VMISVHASIYVAVKAVKNGAWDFVEKPLSMDKTLAVTANALKVQELRRENRELKAQIFLEDTMIGECAAMRRVKDLIRQSAAVHSRVMILGENGTGKELVAREIHRQSTRARKPFVEVNCAAIPDALLESELFGHVKGAFTDARDNRPGKFEVADKGSLFLDEIGNLPYHLQAKLLAALQNRKISRIGSNQTVPIDIRLICATNKNLEQMVGEGQFREDLLYRINTIQIEVPPLRERGNDILVLADFFLKKYSSKYNKPGLKINQQAQDKLMKYTWPGNIRELQHTIEKAVILSEGNILKAEDFFMRPVISGRANELDLTLEEMERRMINQAIDRNNGNLSAAAEQLGITRQTLYNKIKKLGQ